MSIIHGQNKELIGKMENNNEFAHNMTQFNRVNSTPSATGLAFNLAMLMVRL